MPFKTTRVSTAKLQLVLETDRRAGLACRSKAAQIERAAKRYFLLSQRPDNEWRLSETTPPKYINSFRLRAARGQRWHVVNVDPAAVWVEYGAHAGGKTFVLGYRPMTKALLEVSARERLT